MGRAVVARTPMPSRTGTSPAGAVSPAVAGRHGGVRRRRLLGLSGLACLLVLAVAASLAVGARAVPLADVWSALTGPTGSETDIVVRSLRVPRTLLGLAVGVALGLAGALAQGHTRNPIADPGLLGVSAGAALAVVAGIAVVGSEQLRVSVVLAMVGALIAGVLVFWLGSVTGGRRGGTPLSLVLAGVVVTALLTAMTSALVLTNAATLDAYRFWAAGSLANRGPEVLATVLPLLVVGALLAVAQGPTLTALGLGDDVARGLGVRVGAARLVGVLAITVLTGAAVAACGPIAFVGLVAPHVARAVAGLDQRWAVPVSGLAGGVLLLAADVLGRWVSRPGELQVGVALALVGAPVLVLLVRRRRMGAR